MSVDSARTSSRTPIHVSAIVLAFGDEPWLERGVHAIVGSKGCRVDVIVVDNGCDPTVMEKVRRVPGVEVLEPGHNLGFAAGCNFAARAAKGEVLVFINSDAVVHEEALARLATVAQRPEVGIASGSIRLAEDPELLNTAGGDVSYVGLSWPRGYGQRAERFAEEHPITAASGAGMAIRRTVWEDLGGFLSAYFAYKEDVDLSWRCWQRGLSVVYVPDAIVVHHYEFSRNPQKLYLLERNRLLFVLSAYELRTLVFIAPMLVVVELIMVVYAGISGWGRLKCSGWVWLWRNREVVSRHRTAVREHRRLTDAELLPLLSSTFEPENVDRPAGFGVMNRLLTAYWMLVRPLFALPDPRPHRNA